MKYKFLYSVFVLSLALAILSVAAISFADGNITGTVTGNSTGTPLLTDVYIQAIDTSDPSIIYDAFTQPDGTYTIPAVPTGSYYVYSNGIDIYIGQYWDHVVVQGSATVVNVASSPITNINFNLPVGGAITGTVIDNSTGFPIAGVLVEANDPVNAYYGSAVTAGDGTYSISGLLAGSYIAQVYNPSVYTIQYYNSTANTAVYSQATSLNVTLGGTSSGINFNLTKTIHPYDFNGDGMRDILWRNSINANTYLWMMNGTNISSSDFTSMILDSTWQIGGVGDFDGNGTSDILWRNTTTGAISMWFMNGTQVTSSGSPTGTASTAWQIAGIGDFDGNGTSDILWRNTVSGSTYIWFMNNMVITNSGFTTGYADPSVWQIAGIGDFNADGKSDILWRSTANGSTYIWGMDGASIVFDGFTAGYADPTVWQIAGVGDFDANGSSDILWRSISNGSTYIWGMSGTNIVSDGFTAGYADPTVWQIAGVGDFDADGSSDILWRSISNGSTYIWGMSGTNIVSDGFTAGAAGSDWTIQ
jgi:hypothetical protein